MKNHRNATPRRLRIQTLYIDSAAADSPVAARCRDIFSVPARLVKEPKTPYSEIADSTDPVFAGKKTLYLTCNRGPFVRRCPGTKHYLCCGYRILHIGAYCSMDCAYCILQAYFHPPMLTYFTNQDDLFEELETLFQSPGPVRIGTGEFTDSLIWEGLSNLTPRLIQRFGRQETAVLELKTKTSEMAPFREAASVHNRKTIAAWSLNPPEIIRETERGTAPLTARLEAAAACEAMGYPLAFHFDPMFLFTGCEAAYRNLVRRLFAYVSPENIVWISMGTFRFMPEMKPIIEKRFPRTNIPYGEFITGIDGKMRYFKPLRIRLYQAFAEAVRSFAPDVALYLCMEDQTVWQRALGASPDSSEAVAKILDEGAVRRCGLVPRTA